MLDLSWMAWTMPTALFFIVIALLLVAMGVWEWRSPGSECKGILGITTTRGDRLFVSLLCAAYIHLAWLFFTDLPLTYATFLSLIAALFVFKRV